MLHWPTLTRRMSDAMGRTLLAFLMLCFVGLHVALPTATTSEQSVTIVSLVAGDAVGGSNDNAAPVSPDAAAKCHDGCNWLAEWHVPDVGGVPRSLPERLTRAIRPGLFSLDFPPPR